MEIQSVEPYKFYSNESVQLLQRALVNLQEQYESSKMERGNPLCGAGGATAGSNIRDRGYYSDDEMSDNSTAHSDDDLPPAALEEIQESLVQSNGVSTNNQQPKTKSSKKKKTKEEYVKQMGTPPSETLITEVQNETNTALALSIPNVLFPLSKEDDFGGDPHDFNHNRDLAHFYQSRDELAKNQSHLEPILSLYNLAYTLSSYNNIATETTTADASTTTTVSEDYHGAKRQQNVFVVLLHSGRFAAAIYNQGQCIKHSTSTRYTIRKGQGGSQSTMDNAKGKAKSVGSQLRRAGEVQLRNDVYSTMMNWKQDIEDCSLYLLSLSKMLTKGFWEDVDKVFHKNTNTRSTNDVGSGNYASRNRNWNGFEKGSDQVRSIPLDVGKPCFESCCAVYDLLMTCSMLTVDLSIRPEQGEQFDNMEESLYPIDEKSKQRQLESATIVEEYVGHPLTPLHQAAKDGNIEELAALISEHSGNHHDDIDSTAGPKLMTPLHYAAESSSINPGVADHTTAAKCVQILLIQGHANPCMLDSHNRPPYYLSTHDTVRNAFRIARAELGEGIWNWTDGAKVGPPLTNDDLKQRREKAAEKKRRQRQRQKQRKALEQQREAEEERRAKEEEEKKEQEENAKRVRAGLRPKTSGSKGKLMCDFCQKDCTGKRKSQLFNRLDFVYCSPDCMRKHQRELMAAAAAARMSSK